jgi:hypothetical protein
MKRYHVWMDYEMRAEKQSDIYEHLVSRFAVLAMKARATERDSEAEGFAIRKVSSNPDCCGSFSLDLMETETVSAGN